MFLVDLLGALLTLTTFAFLGLAGYLLACRLLDESTRRDALAVAVATLTSSLALALAIGLGLGALGQLRIDLALPALALLCIALLQRAKRDPDPWGPARSLASRSRAHLAARPALAILAAHAAGSELLRGLLRPPLTWDSLMYHLLLAARWLQDHDLAPVLGPAPTNFYGFQPGNGSLWLWWWLAPSHSEIYVNLASALPWLLLGLATGAVARELGARTSWPLAAYVTLLTPAILRFVATQYVDILAGAGLLAAVYFSLRWLAAPTTSDALLAGAGLGITAGAKVLTLPAALAWAGALLVAALWRSGWRQRTPQVMAALAVASLLGGFWYARNLALGAGPFGLRCEASPAGEAADQGKAPLLPRPGSVLDQFGELLANGQLVDAVLGITLPPGLEIGVGPLAILLLPVFALPLLVPRPRRGLAVLVWSQLAVQALLWLTVPYANKNVVFANVRYLDGAIALACAAGFAALELRGVASRWLDLGALTLAVQGLLQLHAEMPRGVRLTLAAIDGLALLLLTAPRLLARLERHRRGLALAAASLLVVASPLLVAFRLHDRGRAMAFELTTHSTSIPAVARAFAWLDLNGEDGAVAVVGWPQNWWVYPAMGPRLERRAIFVNVNAADHRNAAAYPRCDPRVDASVAAWLANLEEQQVRWLHLQRQGDAYAVEAGWAASDPDRFRLRYEDEHNRIYELAPPARPAAGSR